MKREQITERLYLGAELESAYQRLQTLDKTGKVGLSIHLYSNRSSFILAHACSLDGWSTSGDPMEAVLDIERQLADRKTIEAKRKQVLDKIGELQAELNALPSVPAEPETMPEDHAGQEQQEIINSVKV